MPYRNEGQDGYDTIEWAAAQPWSDGHVGTFGLSYPGAVQWLAAVESPPHLKAMVPAMTFSTPRNFFYSGGVFDLSWTAWIWNNIAPDVRVRKGLPGPAHGRRGRRGLEDAARLGPAPPAAVATCHELRDVAPYLFEWMKHPAGRSRGGTGPSCAASTTASKAAVLNLSGWHDEAYGPDGAVTNFLGLRGRPTRPGGPADAAACSGPGSTASVR